jgi:hypothetical protein
MRDSTGSSAEGPGVKLPIRETHIGLVADAECVKLLLSFPPHLRDKLTIYSDKFVITPGFIKVVTADPLILLCGAGNFGRNG